MKDAEVQDTSAKSTNAVAVPDPPVTVGLVNALPPAEYAVPDEFVTSFAVAYAVVVAPKVAEEVYSAM